jgi:hypothetical protein
LAVLIVVAVTHDVCTPAQSCEPRRRRRRLCGRNPDKPSGDGSDRLLRQMPHFFIYYQFCRAFHKPC